jgi:hypothetical protein
MTGEDEDEEKKDDFQISHGLTNEEADRLLKQYGRNELTEVSNQHELIGYSW